MFHFHQSTQGDDGQPLVVHPWKAILRFDRCEPPIEERPSHSGAVSLNEVESGDRVVQDTVYQDFEVGQAEFVGLRGVKVGQSGVDDDLQVLQML